MPLKLVLFDLDGTLLDTLQDLADATNAALAGYGLPALPAEDYRLLVGNGVRILMQRSFAASSRLAVGGGDGGPERPDDAVLVADFNREYDARWNCRTRPYDGITDLLPRLRAAGLRLGILSNKPDAFTRMVVAHYFPDSGFERVTGMRPDRPGKPDPTLALELCAHAGVRPEEAALVGDSSMDIQTALAAGMTPVGVLWGFRSAEELAGAGARRLARTPAALGDLLLALHEPC